MATSKNKVGQSASNAVRSYNRIINNVTEQCQKYRELSSILGRNMKMAVVFSNKDGYLKYLGDEMFVNIIADKCEEEILNNSEWEEGGEPNTVEKIVLPQLPAPVSKLNAKTLQHIIPQVLRNTRGGGYIKWGREDNKPVWWPEDVIFANVKQRPKEQKSEDKWVDCLRKVVKCMYGHHGYDAETYIQNRPDNDDTNEISNGDQESNITDVTRANNDDDDDDRPRTSTPMPTTPRTAACMVPLNRKRNWDESENDPAVRDFLNNSPIQPKRLIKPRDIFTPSKYM